MKLCENFLIYKYKYFLYYKFSFIIVSSSLAESSVFSIVQGEFNLAQTKKNVIFYLSIGRRLKYLSFLVWFLSRSFESFCDKMKGNIRIFFFFFFFFQSEFSFKHLVERLAWSDSSDVCAISVGTTKIANRFERMRINDGLSANKSWHGGIWWTVVSPNPRKRNANIDLWRR